MINPIICLRVNDTLFSLTMICVFSKINEYLNIKKKIVLIKKFFFKLPNAILYFFLYRNY